MALALKIANINEHTFTNRVMTKSCSCCDPDVPGHVDRKFCKQCKGTGREPLSFKALSDETAESRREETVKGSSRRRFYSDSDSSDLEY